MFPLATPAVPPLVVLLLLRLAAAAALPLGGAAPFWTICYIHFKFRNNQKQFGKDIHKSKPLVTQDGRDLGVLNHLQLVNFSTTILLCINTFYLCNYHVHALNRSHVLGIQNMKGNGWVHILYKQMHFSHLNMNLKYKMPITESTYKWNGFQETALKATSFWVSTEDRSKVGSH